MRNVEADRKRFLEVINQFDYDKYIEFVGDTFPEYFDLVEELHNLILSFVASFTLCDHIGDVGNEIGTLLARLGYDWEWDDEHDLFEHLAKLGVKTLNGTSLSE